MQSALHAPGCGRASARLWPILEFDSEGHLECQSPRNLKKNRRPDPTPKSQRSRTHWRSLCCVPRPQTGQARAWGGHLLAAVVGVGWGAGRRQDLGAYRREDDSRIAGGEAERAAPLRRDRREGRQAARPAGKGHWARPTAGHYTSSAGRKGPRPRARAGEQTARALAQERAPM